MLPTSITDVRQRSADRETRLVEKTGRLEEATDLIDDEDVIYVGGTFYSRTPMALLWELVRSDVTETTVLRNLASFEWSYLLESDTSDTMVTSWLGSAVPPILPEVMRTAIEEGTLEVQEWSHYGYGLRLMAGAMGVPYLPTRTMLGSDLLDVSDAIVQDCPFTGSDLALIPAITPDVALIHAQRADLHGNVQITGMPQIDYYGALAADTTIVTCEEIVSEDIMRAESSDIPYFCVDKVISAPFGSFPHECPGYYEQSLEHFQAYSGDLANDGLDGIDKYLQRYFYGPETFEEYLNEFDTQEILSSIVSMQNVPKDKEATEHLREAWQ
jgi:glutaconate CoA-transferase subunit A